MMPISRDIYKRGRLTARPGNKPVKEDFVTGVHKLNLDQNRDGYIYIPATYRPDHPSALAIMLHGSGGEAEQGLSLLRAYADENNIILLAPASRDYTWDIIAAHSFSSDVIFIDQALAHIFDNYNIDPLHLAIGGFSDGASYALSLGLSNGDVFTHVIAFSPGFVYTKEMIGKPKVFISHGTKDEILPIIPCSEQIVKELKKDGFEPEYVRFDGGHEIPKGIAEGAVTWFWG